MLPRNTWKDDAVIVMRRFIAFTGSEFPFISGIRSRRSRQRRHEDLSRIIARDLDVLSQGLTALGPVRSNINRESWLSHSSIPDSISQFTVLA